MNKLSMKTVVGFGTASALVAAMSAGALAAGHSETVVTFDPEAFQFSEGVAVDADANIYASLSPLGQLVRVAPGADLAEMVGSVDGIGEGDNGLLGLFGFPLGANGIEVVGDTAYVGVSETAQVVAIPINDDGTAGTPTTFVQHDSPIDGVAVDAAGNVYTTHPWANEVRRVNPDGDIEVVADVDDGLDAPTSVAIGLGAEGETAYIANFTGISLGGELGAGPSVVSVPTGGE